MTDGNRQINFKVDIAGIIEIMGSSLYSKPDTPIRELLQNAHDAIIRRRKRDLNYQGRIDILQSPNEKIVQFIDDGIGLSEEDAETYLSTLGAGITGLIKKGEPLPQLAESGSDAEGLIGQFGIGLFSGFMIAERLVVESLRADAGQPIRWEAGTDTAISMSIGTRTTPGTTVTLHLKSVYSQFAEHPDLIEGAVKEYADFLPIPIFLNHAKARSNVINVAWFDPTPDREATELALESYFEETPLDVIPLRIENPISIAGVLYVTPQRVPGFSSDPVVTVSVRRMVISRKIQGLLPPWASFLRGVLELNDCSPTTSREDLVRDARFQQVQVVLDELIYEHFEKIAEEEPTRMQSILNWHRYTLAGAALQEDRLRRLLQKTYQFTTSKGLLTYDQILEQSEADPIMESEAERVIWYNGDRRQERWVNSLFAGIEVPCVHTLRSFEESLLGTFVADSNEEGTITDLRIASPSAPNFANGILGVQDMEDAPPAWQDFLASTGAKILCASFRTDQPVMAFLNEKYELHQTFDELRKNGTIPSGFQRMIDAHFEDSGSISNEVLLNRNHRLVDRALSQKTSGPLASVLRLLVINALNNAGAAVPRAAQQQQTEDLDWIAEALWGKNP